MRKYKSMLLEDLENALAEHAPAGGELASELPPLTIDGIPVSVDKMTQVRLFCILLTCLHFYRPDFASVKCYTPYTL